MLNLHLYARLLETEGVRVGEVAARRRVLRQFVTKVEVGRRRGRLSYTFPLSQVGRLYLVPLEESYIKVRSLELVFA